jgi:hypothetical protein
MIHWYKHKMALFVVIVYSIINNGVCSIKTALFNCCVYILVFRLLWLIPHHSSPLFLERKCSGCSSSSGGRPISIAGTSNEGHFVFKCKGWPVVDHRQLLWSWGGGLSRPIGAAMAEVHKNKNNGDQTYDEEGEEGGPDNGRGG